MVLLYVRCWNLNGIGSFVGLRTAKDLSVQEGWRDKIKKANE